MRLCCAPRGVALMSIDRRRLFAAIAGAGAAGATTRGAIHAGARCGIARRDRRGIARPSAECFRRSDRSISARDRASSSSARGVAAAAGLLSRRIAATAALRGHRRRRGGNTHRHVRRTVDDVGHRQRPPRHLRPRTRRRRHPASGAAWVVAFGARPFRAHRRLRDHQCRPQRHRARGHRRRRHGEHDQCG